MLSFLELFNKIKAYNPNSDFALIQKAYILAKNSHGNQKDTLAILISLIL